MPAKIEPIKSETPLAPTYIFPGHASLIEVYDKEIKSDHLLVVSCEPSDLNTNIFLFAKPDTYVDEDEVALMEEYCDEATLVSSIDGHGVCRVDATTRDNSPLELIVRHMVIMAEN